MQLKIESYESLFQDCEKDIKECEKEIIQNEREIEEKRQTIKAVDAKRQELIGLQEFLRKIINPLDSKNESQPDENVLEEQTDVQSENPESVFTVKTSKGLVEIPTDAFKGADNIREAATHLLRMVASPLKHPEIADALLKGGFETKSVVAFSENVRSTLRSASKSLKTEVIRKNSSWHLKEWFSDSPTTSNRNRFTPKGEISVSNAIAKAIKEANRPLSLNDLEAALLAQEIAVSRSTIRAALTNGKKRFKRVEAGIYDVIEK